jgi:predicted nucleotidyltransferase
MRLSPEFTEFLAGEISEISVPVRVFLFGSRTSDETKGGDIDILILSETKLDRKTLRQIRINFIKKFMYLKLDLVNFTDHEDNAFKELIMESAIFLSSNHKQPVAMQA